MQYLLVRHLYKSFTGKPLLNDVNFAIEKWQKVALVAQNGAGKTTLLKLIMGQLEWSAGDILFTKNVRVSFLSQDFEVDPNMSVLEALFTHENELGQLIRRYEALLLDPNHSEEEMQKILHQIEDAHAREYEVKVKTIIGQLNLTQYLTQTMWSLSWGEAKRVALAKALLDEPDFLILDEPTNHLDLDMIERLENYLKQSHLTLLLVTHDRYFLERVCTNILELDRGKIHSYNGNYQVFLEKKAQREELEQKTVHNMKQLRRHELDRMRRAPGARRTKQYARIKDFEELEDTYKASKSILNEKAKKLTIEVNQRRMGDKILKIHHLKKSFGDKLILKDFSHDFRHGERVGIVGKNWVGKSTFVNILTGEESADSGDIQQWRTVYLGHYQQQQALFQTDKRVLEIVKDVAEYIFVAKWKKLTASQMLERFLFSPNQQQAFASTLSWGEKRRLHLLLVLIKNPNFLILDEPTNDLDLVTLAILEEFLLDYTGCLIVISHDRFFMDRIVDHIFAFEWDWIVRDYRWSYSEYVAFKAEEQQLEKKQLQAERQKAEAKKEAIISPDKKKLSYKEKLEMETLWKEISILEKRVDEINFIYQSETLDGDKMKKLGREMDEIMKALTEKETRWLELAERG